MRANCCLLTLPLLVAGVRADDHGSAVPLDHAAALAHRLHGRSDLHRYETAILPQFDRGLESGTTHGVRNTVLEIEPRHSGGCAVKAHRSKTGVAVRIRGPASVTATVCSKWAERV